MRRFDDLLTTLTAACPHLLAPCAFEPERWDRSRALNAMWLLGGKWLGYAWVFLQNLCFEYRHKVLKPERGCALAAASAPRSLAHAIKMQIFAARFFGLPHWRRGAQVGREHFATRQSPDIVVQADAAVPVAQHGQHFILFTSG